MRFWLSGYSIVCYWFQESSYDQVALLQEMFPEASAAEVRHCMSVAEGDIAKAAQLALHRQEAGQSIVSNLAFLTVCNNHLNLYLSKKLYEFESG